MNKISTKWVYCQASYKQVLDQYHIGKRHKQGQVLCFNRNELTIVMITGVSTMADVLLRVDTGAVASEIN